MNPNIQAIASVLTKSESGLTPDLRYFVVADYSLFQYGLSRGDVLLVSSHGKPKFAELAVYELDGSFRAGIPQVESTHWLTRLSKFITASKVEFIVAPAVLRSLFRFGNIVNVISAPVVR